MKKKLASLFAYCTILAVVSACMGGISQEQTALGTQSQALVVCPDNTILESTPRFAQCNYSLQAVEGYFFEVQQIDEERWKCSVMCRGYFRLNSQPTCEPDAIAPIDGASPCPEQRITRPKKALLTTLSDLIHTDNQAAASTMCVQHITDKQHDFDMLCHFVLQRKLQSEELKSPNHNTAHACCRRIDEDPPPRGTVDPVTRDVAPPEISGDYVPQSPEAPTTPKTAPTTRTSAGTTPPSTTNPSP